MLSSSAPLYSAIDQGTTSSRFIVFDQSLQHVVAVHHIEHTQITPHPGWLSHDPEEIFKNVVACMKAVVQQLGPENAKRIRSVGITNQRETTVAWSKSTKTPLCNAIVWSDSRTSDTLEKYANRLTTPDAVEYCRKKTGLPVSTYFSAVKMRWMLDNEPKVAEAAKAGDLCFGTMDSWLIYKLNNCDHENFHVTDVTNASRTLLMNILTRQWDAELASPAFFNIPLGALPKKILPCAHATGFGKIEAGGVGGGGLPKELNKVPICGCVGDQQGALVGQLCFNKGELKNTYGTGCFMLANVGSDGPVFSKAGLLTTVAYQLGEDQPCFYALEGAVGGAGSGIQWLRDKLQIIKTAKESEDLALTVANSGGVAFVPAFGGLLSPHWEPNARGTIVGISQQTTKAHIVRAKLEAIAHQVNDLVDCIEEDLKQQQQQQQLSSSSPSTTPSATNKSNESVRDGGKKFITSLKVDGGMSANNLLMQLQADYLGFSVLRPAMLETTAKGAALCGAVGCGSIKDFQRELSTSSTSFVTITPKMSDKERQESKKKWDRAINVALHYAKL